MSLKTSLWLLRHCDQFDYRSSYLRNQSFDVYSNSAVYRSGQEVLVLPLNAQVPAGAEKLAVIYVHEDSALLVNPQSLPNCKSPSKNLWLVAGKNKQDRSPGCKLREGDVIRLADYEWTITEINAGEPAYFRSHSSTLLHSASEQTQCKICLSCEAEADNPLVAPCSCKGSVQYLHVNCLDHWLSSKLRHMDMHYRSQYSPPAINCNVCGDPLPQNLEVNGKRFSNLGVSKPEGRYIVLRDTSSNEVHLWHWDECRTLGLGTGIENEIKLQGLSDLNSKLVFKGPELRIRDVQSQFGTLVQVQKPLVVTRGDTVTVQSANVLIQVSIKRGGFFGCFSSRRRSVSYQDLIDEDLA